MSRLSRLSLRWLEELTASSIDLASNVVETGLCNIHRPVSSNELGEGPLQERSSDKGKFDKGKFQKPILID
jgi:hypothetical protein